MVPPPRSITSTPPAFSSGDNTPSPEQSPVRILLVTDAASEGIDLQNHCYRLVLLEIPWNPNRMEQRNGRIDRHGQRQDPLVYHFVGKGYQERTLDARAMPPFDETSPSLLTLRAAQAVERCGSARHQGCLTPRNLDQLSL